MDGGRIRPSLSKPGNKSSGLLKKMANPSVKKLGVFPGPEREKISRGIWKGVEPMVMWMGSS